MTTPENKAIDCVPGLLKREAPSGRNTAEVDEVTIGVNGVMLKHSLEMFASTFDICICCCQRAVRFVPVAHYFH